MLCPTFVDTFDDMAKQSKAPKGASMSFRFDGALIARLRKFANEHPMQPTLTALIELAMREWLDRNDSAPKRSTPPPPTRAKG